MTYISTRSAWKEKRKNKIKDVISCDFFILHPMGNQHKSDQVRVCLLFYLCPYHLYLKQLCHERRELLPKKFFLTIINDESLTFTPQGSVASSNAFCITWLIVSLSDNISARFLVPRTFRNVVAAKSRVEWLNYMQEKAWKWRIKFINRPNWLFIRIFVFFNLF